MAIIHMVIEVIIPWVKVIIVDSYSFPILVLINSFHIPIMVMLIIEPNFTQITSLMDFAIKNIKIQKY